MATPILTRLTLRHIHRDACAPTADQPAIRLASPKTGSDGSGRGPLRNCSTAAAHDMIACLAPENPIGTVMSRLSVFPLFLSFILIAAPAAGQEAETQAAGPVPAVVLGLVDADLLNVREQPSPLGRTLARLPNGALVTSHECRSVDGYEWCRVGARQPESQASIVGWAPARYLEPLEEMDAASHGVADETRESAGPSLMDTAARTGRGSRLEAGGEALPPGLEARFSAGSALSVDDLRNGAAIIAPLPDVATVEVFDEEIPCARHLGQPMTICDARIERMEPGTARIVVMWPDGGRRVLDFRDGVPVGSDGAHDLRYTREATLNLIRIGDGERFEVLDALPFGEGFTPAAPAPGGTPPPRG